MTTADDWLRRGLIWRSKFDDFVSVFVYRQYDKMDASWLRKVKHILKTLPIITDVFIKMKLKFESPTLIGIVVV